MEDRRGYLRVKTNIQALLKKVEDGALSSFFRVNTKPSLQFDFNYKELGIPEGLSLFFKYIDGKLDLILSILGKDIIEKEFDSRTVVVELSGGGVKCIRPSEEFGEGDVVELLLYLSHIPLMVVSAVGLITRIIRKNNVDYLVIEFEKIREKDRELIVRFVFQEQREQIRTEKY